MAEEPIVFDIQAPGVQAVVDAFVELGVSGETALSLVSAAASNFKLDADKLAAVIKTVSEYMEAGGQAAGVLENGLLKLETSAIDFIRTQTDLISGLRAASTEIRAQADAHVILQQAYVASQNATRIWADLSVQSALETEQAASKSEAAKTAALSQATSLRAVLALQEQAAYSASEAAKTAAATEGANLRIRAALEEETALAAAAAVKAKNAQIATDLSVRAALEEEAAIAALGAEAAAAAVELEVLMRAQQGGAAVAAAYRTSLVEDAAALAALKAEVVTTGAAFAESTSFVTGMAAQLGLLFTASAAIKDINITDKIQTQLEAVTGSVEGANALFATLYNTAQATAQPIGETVKLFAQLNASLAPQGKTINDVAAATDTLAKVIRGTGVAGENTGRVMHELQEIISGSANAQRAWNSIFAQAPALGRQLSLMLGEDSVAHEKNNANLDKATAKLDAFNVKQSQSGVSMREAQSAANTASAALTNLTARHTIDTAASAQSTKQTQTYNLELRNATARVNETRSALATATAEENTNTTAKKRALEASVQKAQAAVNEDVSAKLVTKSAKEQADALNAIAERNVTIGESFTRLNNSFAEFLKTSGSASAASQIFKDVLGFLGDNIRIVVPLVVALGAAFAILKVAEVVVGFGELVVAMGKYAAAAGSSAIATLVLDAALTPIGLVVIALTIAVAALAAKFGFLTGTFDFLKSSAAAVRDAIFGTAASADELKTKATDSGTSILDLVGKLSGTGGLTPALTDPSKGLVPALGQTSVALGNGVIALNNYGTAAQDTMKKLSALVGAESLAAKVAGSGNAGNNINQAFNATTFTGINDNTDLDGSYARYAANKAAALNAGKQVGSSFGIQGFKTGGVVAGSSGTDTKMIAVSPGEHVTIQTPEQYRAGKVNTSNTSGRYASGGVAFSPAGSQSTTGFNAISASDYYKTYAAMSGASANDNSSITSATNMTNDNTSTSASTAVNAATQTAGTFTSQQVDSPGGADSTYDSAKQAALIQYQKDYATWQKKVQADREAVSAAEVITAVDGVPRPTSLSMTQAQAEKWVDINGGFQIRPFTRPGIPTYAGDATAAYKTFKTDLGSPPTPVYGRNGLDVTVPGSTGVDTRLVNLAVSPGEKISVRTPQQQRAEEAVATGQVGGGGGRGVVTMNVYTKDANSFGQSQSQILASTQRKLAKFR